MNLFAVCDDCGHKHQLHAGRQSLVGQMDEWNAKHIGHRTDVFYARDLRDLRRQYLDNANVKQADGTEGAFTITLASLATDSNLLVGRNSNKIDNSSNLYLDYRVGGKITTGTNPTASTFIEVWAYGSLQANSGTPIFPDTITGADAGVTMTQRNIMGECLKLIASLIVTATSNVTYWFGPTGLAQFFGGSLPPYFGIFVVHNTAVALHATGGNHALYYVPTYNTVT